MYLFCDMVSFYDEEKLAAHPTCMLEDRPLSAIRDCLFNIFRGTFNIGGHFSIGDPGDVSCLVTGTYLSWGV